MNGKKLMQGITDVPLDSLGCYQAAKVDYDATDFDAVYSSPLERAVMTASLSCKIDKNEIIIDNRLLECDFGPYEGVSYYLVGPRMILYWCFPDKFKVPKGVETLESMISRCEAFLDDIKKTHYEDIMRVLCGILENAPNKIKWYPKPENCEIRKYIIE